MAVQKKKKKKKKKKKGYKRSLLKNGDNRSEI
jgi:hypothetical protein